MSKPVLSAHFESRTPSDVRLAQMKYEERKVKPQAVINVGIGNVSLPTNPAMQERMFNLGAPESPFAKGVIRKQKSKISICNSKFSKPNGKSMVT
jgi:aspartate aminotransferase